MFGASDLTSIARCSLAVIVASCSCLSRAVNDSLVPSDSFYSRYGGHHSWVIGTCSVVRLNPDC